MKNSRTIITNSLKRIGFFIGLGGLSLEEARRRGKDAPGRSRLQDFDSGRRRLPPTVGAEVSMPPAAGRVVVLAVVAAMGPGAARAQSPSPSPSALVSPCLAPEYRQFDFWAGTGTCSIPPATWSAPTTSPASTTDASSRSTGKRKGPQSPDRLELQHLQPGHPPMASDLGGQHGRIPPTRRGFAERPHGPHPPRCPPTGAGLLKHRITLTPKPDGTVRQFWETSPTAARPGRPPSTACTCARSADRPASTPGADGQASHRPLRAPAAAGRTG